MTHKTPRGIKPAGRFTNSPYAERPEGSRNTSLFEVKPFGTVRTISY
jgi:hypothetical protein